VSSSELDLLTAAIAAISVLAGVALQYFFSVLNRRRTQARENEQRWLDKRHKAITRLLTGAVNLESKIWEICSLLDDDEREERLPGYTSIFMTSDEGLPPFLDESSRNILIGGCYDAMKRLEKMALVIVEIQLIGSPEESLASLKLFDALWDAVGLVESFAKFSDAADQVDLCRKYRELLVDAARSSFQIPGSIFEVLSARRHPSTDLT
jgi:hypothetical protein